MSTQPSQLLFRREIRWIALSAAIVLGTVAYLVWARPQAPEDIEAYRGTQLNTPSPDFRLHDHSGEPLALSELRGKVVVLTFFDSKCVDVCPMVSVYLRETDRMLGRDAERVVFLAVNVNARANSVADVAAATEQWLLGELTNWHFLTGSPEELEPGMGRLLYLRRPHARTATRAYGRAVSNRPRRPPTVVYFHSVRPLRTG